MPWVRVASAAEIPPGQGKPVRAGALELAVFNEEGDYFALDDTCPHQGASLGEGLLHQGRVICPWHSWMFELRTGQAVRIPGIAVNRYPARRRGDDVEVEIPDTSGDGATHEGPASF